MTENMNYDLELKGTGVEHLHDIVSRLDIVHYVGTALSRLDTSRISSVGAEKIRQELIKALESKKDGTMMAEILELLNGSDWSRAEGIKQFKDQYDRFRMDHGLEPKKA